MAPILIDSRGLLKLVFISVLITFVVFAAGFFIGYQQATAFHLAGSNTQALLLPEKPVVHASAIEPQLPELMAAGEALDVDQPGTASEAVAVDVIVEPVYEKPVSPGKTNTSEITGYSKTQNNSTHAAVKQKVITKKTPEPIASSAIVDPRAVAEKTPLVITAMPRQELNKIKYSIQVGMYGRLINAENMMRKLQAKQWDAYVSDYSNQQDEVRYNVRLGYFKDKESALAALKVYKKNQKADGYLVNFSAKNIVDVAHAETIEQPVITEETEKKKSPDSILSESMSFHGKADQDKIETTSTLLSEIQTGPAVTN